jgi:hypothetical protein
MTAPPSDRKLMTIPVPIVAPLGIECGIDGVRDVWDALVKPGQARREPQSVEDRLLMAILRAVYEGFTWLGQQETSGPSGTGDKETHMSTTDDGTDVQVTASTDDDETTVTATTTSNDGGDTEQQGDADSNGAE